MLYKGFITGESYFNNTSAVFLYIALNACLVLSIEMVLLRSNNREERRQYNRELIDKERLIRKLTSEDKF